VTASRRDDRKTSRPKWVGIRESVFRHNSAAGPRSGSGFAMKSDRLSPNLYEPETLILYHPRPARDSAGSELVYFRSSVWL